MAKPLLPDELWARVRPLLPPPKPRRPDHPGRKPLDDRRCLTGILFVLKTGIPWEYLPREMGCGSGMTCWRRLRDWQAAGVWGRLHRLLLAELEQAGRLDWSRAAVDSGTVRARGGGKKTGRNPTDRGKRGSKHHVLTDANGVPPASHTTAANVPDVTQLVGTVDASPALPMAGGRVAAPDPAEVYADRGYDSRANREAMRARGIGPRVAKRGEPHGSGLGRVRWVVERTIGWLHQFGRLRVRTDRDDGVHDAFLKLACALICFRLLH